MGTNTVVSLSRHSVIMICPLHGWPSQGAFTLAGLRLRLEGDAFITLLQNDKARKMQTSKRAVEAELRWSPGKNVLELLKKKVCTRRHGEHAKYSSIPLLF